MKAKITAAEHFIDELIAAMKKGDVPAMRTYTNSALKILQEIFNEAAEDRTRIQAITLKINEASALMNSTQN